MNTHGTSTLNSSSSSSNFKISSVLPYLLVIALSSLLCFGFCRFVINQTVSGNVEITRIMGSNVLTAEHYMEGNLKCATTALDLYLQNKPIGTNDELKWLADEVGIFNYYIFNADGKRINGGKKWIDRGYRVTTDLPSLKKMKDNNVKSKMVTPLGFEKSNTSNYSGYKVGMEWVPSKRIFLDAYMQTSQLAKLLKDAIRKNSSILGVSLSTPSGVVLVDTCNLNSNCKVDEKNELQYPSNNILFNDYVEKPVVTNYYGEMIVSLPFGGLQNAEGYTKDAPYEAFRGQANDAGQYFYVMNVTFDKTELNKQIAIIISGFIVFTLITCIAIYYINKSISQSSELAELSERTADKVTHLCNTRLGEVRRYVTKIVGDSMRVKNMNKDLPEEMVELLDRAFREVDERDLILAKKEDVQ